MKRMSIFFFIVLLLGVGYATGLSAKTKPNPSYIDLNLRSFSTEEAETIIANYHKDPNTHYHDMTDVLFYQLNQENPLLAKELGKLPEFQDEVSPSEAEALEDIVSLYNLDKDNFDNAFQQMYQMGIPEVRQYCTPLQALFWIAEREEFDESNNPISNGISDSLYLKSFFMKAWGDLEGPRWEDIDEVTARLNSPELIDYYTRKAFKYYDPGRKSQPYSYIFYKKKGHCLHYSKFIKHCLDRGGYVAIIYDQPAKKEPHKFVGYRDKDNKWYVIDNGKPKAGGISEPFNSEEELMKMRSCVRFVEVKPRLY